MGVVRVGMSGFSYPEWIGDFYPPKTKREQMLAHYATRFDAVEINMTFRRDAAPSTIERWRDAVPPEFRFVFKANQRITHFRRLVGADDAVEAFVGAVKPVGERLGGVLFQTPANLKFDPDVLEAFLAALPNDVAFAFEPRHESFQAPEVDAILKKHGVARCLNDWVHDPDAVYSVTSPIAYFRFHRDQYSAKDVERRASMVRSIAASGADVYVFFAHEDNPESVRPALRLRELVTS